MTRGQRERAIRQAKLAAQRVVADAFDCGRLAERGRPPEYSRLLAATERQLEALFKRLEKLA